MEKSNELTKSLVSLIDETLEELDELKKSKFSAAEIKIEGSGDKELAGKPVNGELDAKKAEDKKEDEEKKEEKKEDKEDDKEDDVEKGVLDEAEKSEKEEDEEKKEDKEDDKQEDKKEDKEEVEKSVEENKDLRKSLEEQEELMKSYIDSKFDSLVTKITSLTELVDSINDQPVERKGVPAGQFHALQKSEDVKEPLSKTDLANKLFELKKSGTNVDSSDIIRVETGSASDVQSIAEKYNL